jgi:quinol monooxygenase YgiN
MSTIETGGTVLTFINVFTIEPDQQDRLVTLLAEAANQTMRHLPGYVSANIHRSLDGKRVINYAQWRSMADFQAMRKNPEAAAHIQAVAGMASFEAGLYEVAWAIEAPAEVAA